MGNRSRAYAAPPVRARHLDRERLQHGDVQWPVHNLGMAPDCRLVWLNYHRQTSHRATLRHVWSPLGCSRLGEKHSLAAE